MFIVKIRQVIIQTDSVVLGMALLEVQLKALFQAPYLLFSVQIQVGQILL